MNQNLQPQDIQKSLDEYIERKKNILDKEIIEIAEINHKEISKVVKKHAEKMIYAIEHPPEKLSLWSKINSLFSKKKPKGKKYK